jgi:hypothetical protein
MKRLKAPSPALVISLVALFVALGGTALAATSYINGKNIKPHSIPKNRLTASAIKGLKGNRGRAGAKGAKGAKGDTGDVGPVGPTNAYSTYALGPTPLGAGETTVASLPLSAGSYVLVAKTQLEVPGSQGTGCTLSDSTAGTLDANDTSVAFSTVPLAAPLATTGSTISVICGSNELDATALNTHLVAIKVGSVSGN